MMDLERLRQRILSSGDFTAREKRYLLARLDAVPVRHCGRCVHAWFAEDGAAIACSFKEECHFEEVRDDDRP